ncbi:MAG: NAD(P)H-dependent oxidoreductase [Parcubacteria group bacterium]
MNIPIILGTGREGRISERAAEYVKSVIVESGHNTEIIDPRDYKFLFTDNETSRGDGYREKIKNVDALVIVTPEYNHSFPGELKILLDTAYEEYFYKPVGICGVSASPFGGARAVEQLKPTLSELRMFIGRESVFFSSARELFGEAEIKDKSFKGRVKAMLDEIVLIAGKVKPLSSFKTGEGF